MPTAKAKLRAGLSRFPLSRALSQEYYILLNAIHNAIFLLSPDLRIIWANKYVVDLMGFCQSDAGRQSCFDLLKHAEKPCGDCHALSCFRTGKPTSGRISSHDGRIWASDACPVRDRQGRVNRVIMIYRDVTEEIKLRAETMHAAHMASLGELAAGVAHEINNPINGIINYAQMLADRSPSGDTGHAIAGEIMGECRRIARIVSSLLSFARDRNEEKTTVCMHEVLSNTFSLSQRLLEKNGVHLKIDLPPESPCVDGIPNQLQQVFLNVVTNALYALNKKYPGASNDKKLEISGKEVSRDGRPYFHITFRDQGTGIPASIIDKVFQPFFSTKPEGQGTGLGLSISYNIISDHKGRMRIESREGAFTSVSIELPVRCGKTPAGPGDARPGDRLRAGMKEEGQP